MINQISDNIPSDSRIDSSVDHAAAATAARVADHITRFWARPMKEQIIAYALSDGAQLNPVSLAAIQHLQQQ